LPDIDIRGLRYAYPPRSLGAGSVPVLKGIDLCVERGEFLSLMGPTGVGKSTLCMALNGLVPQATGGDIAGSVTVLGRDPRRTPVADLAAHVGIVYQDADSQLFSASVEDEIIFGPENLGVPAQEIADRLDWALEAVGMSPYRRRPPTQLSGGQKQRVAIAASLAMLPEVLILDEPTASLDPVGKGEVFAVIGQLCHERRMTIVMVSQDAERVAEFSDRVAIMVDGRIARCDPPADVFYDADLLARAGLASPQVCELAGQLNAWSGRRDRYTLLDVAVQTLSAWAAKETSGDAET